MNQNIGTLRHSAKHRQQALKIRDRFPRMVTRRFRVSYQAAMLMRQNDIASLVRAPRGAKVQQFQLPDCMAFEVIVTHPAHLPVVINPRFVQEIRT